MSDNAAALSAKAASLYRGGRLADACDIYARLLATDANRPNDWLNYGLLLRQQAKPRQALEAYDKALEHGIAHAEEIHVNKAVIYVDDLGDPAKALSALEAALAIDPYHVPALLNLGNLHEDGGRSSDAREAYSRALSADPGSPLALTRLAEVTRFDDAGHPLIEQLRVRLASHDLSPLDRADLGFALGRALDQAKSYSDAFSAYEEANAASRALAKSPYSPSGAEKFVTAIIEAFPRRTGSDEAGGAAPIFICGMFRSGSTLVERILAAHSLLTAGGELPILPSLVRSELQPYPASISSAGEKPFARLRTQYCDRVADMGFPLGGLTDKRPDNILHVGLIKRIFPNAKIVLTHRDPMDNCLSVFFAHLSPDMAYSSTLESAAHWYLQQERLARHWQDLFPEDVHIADYDALVADPEPNIRSLLKFLDLPWEDACLSPHAIGGQVRTASAWQVREPVHTRSSGRWRNYANRIEPLRMALDFEV